MTIWGCIYEKQGKSSWGRDECLFKMDCLYGTKTNKFSHEIGIIWFIHGDKKMTKKNVSCNGEKRYDGLCLR